MKIIEAIEATGFGNAIDVQVPKLNHLNLWLPHFQAMQREGRELWFYTCCHPLGRYPNRFLDQPLVKTRALHWLGYLYGLDGYLHWGLSYIAEGVDPYSEEGVSKGLPLGDRAIMYPGRDGPVGSLRWSAMRDGLEDYEYLWVLQQRLAALKKRVGDGADWLDPRQRPLELCRRVVTSFYEHTRQGETLLAARARNRRRDRAVGANAPALRADRTARGHGRARRIAADQRAGRRRAGRDGEDQRRGDRRPGGRRHVSPPRGSSRDPRSWSSRSKDGKTRKAAVITPPTILPNFRFCSRLPCREPGFGRSMARASGGSRVA